MKKCEGCVFERLVEEGDEIAFIAVGPESLSLILPTSVVNNPDKNVPFHVQMASVLALMLGRFDDDLMALIDKKTEEYIPSVEDQPKKKKTLKRVK